MMVSQFKASKWKIHYIPTAHAKVGDYLVSGNVAMLISDICQIDDIYTRLYHGSGFDTRETAETIKIIRRK